MPPSRVNPFQVRHLATGAGFANRHAELVRLTRTMLTPGDKLVLYGDRRLGKTAALAIAADRARRRGALVAAISLAPAADLADAVRRVLAAVHAVAGRSWHSVLADLAARLKLTLTLAPNPDGHGLPGLSLALEPGAPGARPTLFTDALDAINEQAGRRKLRLALVVDEFQRLLEWGGESMEWALKDTLERHRHVAYLFSGSSRSLIEDMVVQKRRPLWKTVSLLHLGPIPADEFAAWMVVRARATGVRFTDLTARDVLRLAGPRTRDVIVLAGATWDDAQLRRGAGDPVRALDAEVAALDVVHQRGWESCTDQERRLLLALAREPMAELHAERVRRIYRLGAASSASAGLKALVTRSILARDGKRYVFDDPFFRRWVELGTR